MKKVSAILEIDWPILFLNEFIKAHINKVGSSMNLIQKYFTCILGTYEELEKENYYIKMHMLMMNIQRMV